jgi:hypothetical protein
MTSYIAPYWPPLPCPFSRFVANFSGFSTSRYPVITHQSAADSPDVTVCGLSCSFCCRNPPLLRCYCLSCTSVVYGHPPIYTVRSITQYNDSSILQFFLPTSPDTRRYHPRRGRWQRVSLTHCVRILVPKQTDMVSSVRVYSSLELYSALKS